MVKDKLELLAMAENYIIEKKTIPDYGEEYWINGEYEDVAAVIGPDATVKYYVTGVDNSCVDMAVADIDALVALRAFCQYLMKE